MHGTINWRKFVWVSGSLLTVFLILFLALHHQVRGALQEENGLRTTLTAMEKENGELNAQLSQVGTEDYIVNSAMTNYAFMNKNDLRFQFTNPEALYAYTEEELKILMDETAD